MGLREIPGLIKNTPNYLNQSFTQVKKTASNAISWTSRQFSNVILLGTESSLGKPIYERYIRPLDKKDALIFGTFAVIASAVMFTAIAILGKPIVTIAVAGGISILCLSAFITDYRIKTKFNKEVAAIYRDLYRVLQSAKFADPKLDEIEVQRAKLRDKKYEHLKDNLKALDQYITQYKNAGLSTDNKFKNVKKGFKAHLHESSILLDKSLANIPV